MPNAIRQPALWPWVTLLVISLGVMAGIAWQIRPAAIYLPTLRPRPPVSRSTPRPATDERRRVRLFFPQESGETLKEVEREIPRRASLSEEARVVLRELSLGTPGGLPTVPPGTEVRQVFLDAFGILYLDVNRGILATLSAPDTQAELAVLAIVNTLATSFHQTKRVQFLVESQEVSMAAGGLDLRRPISPRFPGEAGPPVISPPLDSAPE
jgi:Sporulation and spore germination